MAQGTVLNRRITKFVGQKQALNLKFVELGLWSLPKPYFLKYFLFMMLTEKINHLIFCLLFPVLLIGLSQSSLAQSKSYKITGTVYNTALGPNRGEEGASVILFVTDSIRLTSITDTSGRYNFPDVVLESDKTYKLVAGQTGSFDNYQELYINDSINSAEYKIDFFIHLTKCGTIIRMGEHLPTNMFREYSSKLSDTMKNALKIIAAELIDNPTLLIQISGHSDIKEAKAGDTLLSYNRALEAQKLLVQYGINRERLILSGLGCTSPFVVESDTLQLKTDMTLSESTIESFTSAESKRIARQFNRRISIDILRIDFLPKE